LGGQTVLLNVTALRRKAVEKPTETPPAQAATEKPAIVKAQPLDHIAAPGANAIDASAAEQPVTRLTVAAVDKPFIQVGIFSVEQNAKNTAEAMIQAGIVPQVIPGKSKSKTFWRVIVGPATSTSKRTALLKKVKSRGFSDAYYVTN
jgi:cell division protein FtsN